MSSVPAADLDPAAKANLLCTYAALILHDDGVDITADNITKLVAASGNSVEPYMPSLFARALENKDIGDLLKGGGGPAVPMAAAAAEDTGAASGAGKKKEEPKEEEEEEEADLGFSLFD
eukprot:GHVT01096448.1.p1 GENE.GHVT01096448.1~~GHVT01096448.1.p1  ORF type:complete len:119 (+),score=45.44 GHVT01096448.1:130-486(+)